MTAVVINTDNQELNPVRAPRENVGRKRGSTLDGHGLLPAEFKQRHFSSQCSGKRLSVADQARCGQGKIITDFEELLNALVGDEMTHGCTVVCANHNTTLERDSNSTGPGLHNGLLFLHGILSNPTLLEPWASGAWSVLVPMTARPNGSENQSLHLKRNGVLKRPRKTSDRMRRRRRKVKDEAQSSLDAFSQSTPTAEPPSEPHIPEMPDLDLLEAAEAKLEQVNEPAVSEASTEGAGPRSFSMPSSKRTPTQRMPRGKVTYHNLDQLYPDAPVPLYEGEMVLHNSTLLDLTGCGALMDWVADGHGCIVEMKRMMKRKTEFNQAISMLSQFVEGDVQGQIIRITDTRLLLLPQGCRGIKGTEMESFAVSPDDLTDVYE